MAEHGNDWPDPDDELPPAVVVCLACAVLMGLILLAAYWSS